MREIKHLSVHQRLRSAISDSQQPSSPIGFLFLKTSATAMCGTTGSYVDMLNKGTWLVDCVVSLSKVMSSHEFSIAKSCMMLIVMCSFTMRQTQQEPNIFEGFCENHPDRFVNSINIWILEFIINWLPWGRQVQAHPLEREGASPVGCFPQWFSPRVHPSCRHPNHMATSARFVRIETTDQQVCWSYFPLISWKI